MSDTQTKLDALKAKLAAGATVVSGVVALVQHMIANAQAAKDDPEELQALLDGYAEQTDALAAALVEGTQAEGEEPEPAQTGGEDSGDATTGANSPAGGEGGDSITGGEGGDTLDGGGA